MATKTKASKFSNINSRLLIAVIISLAILATLMLYKLGSLMPGISHTENSVYSQSLSLKGLYHQPLNLPLDALRAVDFKLFSPVSQFMLRLPNAILGAITIAAFYWLMAVWYSRRTAIMGTAMFAASAWTLHVSRLASLSVSYLAAMTVFLLTTALLQKRPENRYFYALVNFIWGLLLYVPGMVFIIAYNLFRQRGELGFGIKRQNGLSGPLYVIASLLPLPILVEFLTKGKPHIMAWLGLPNHFATPLHILKELAAVFIHLFARGPLIADSWLGQLPVLDIFSIIAALIGLYFYIIHIKATRTHLLIVSFIIGTVLIALGGSLDLSFIMPIVYIWITAGIAYLLQQWLTVFPQNPIARSIGIGLIVLAVAVSCFYNLRSYFIAWPHNHSSVSAFAVHRKS